MSLRTSLSTESLCFNEEIYMDFMSIDDAPILHIVYAATEFSAIGLFLDGNTGRV